MNFQTTLPRTNMGEVNKFYPDDRVNQALTTWVLAYYGVGVNGHMVNNYPATPPGLAGKLANLYVHTECGRK